MNLERLDELNVLRLKDSSTMLVPQNYLDDLRNADYINMSRKNQNASPLWQSLFLCSINMIFSRTKRR
jgi:hypothetical protein